MKPFLLAAIAPLAIVFAVPTSTPTAVPSMAVYEDGSFVTYDGTEAIDSGCLPFALCNR
jgi:hypothetical protein